MSDRTGGHTDLIACVALAALAAAATVVGASPIIRTVVAIPLVLFAPGYALLNAAFPAHVLPAVERLLISLGASICLTILAGLAIAGLGIPLDGLSWVVSLTAIVTVLSIVAVSRRLRSEVDGPALSIAAMPRVGAVLIVVAALIAVDAVLGSRLIAQDQQPPAPLQLWMVPISDSPTDALIGVKAGGTGARYRLVISASGNEIYVFDLTLKPQETWERNVTFADDLRDEPIVARLYEGTSTVEQRFVILQPVTHGG